MVRNYLKVALRNLWKDRFYSSVNILGLAIGLATCLLILLYVKDELGYDRYAERADHIYRVVPYINFGGDEANYAVAPAPMGAALLNDYPEVESYCRFRTWGDWLVRTEDAVVNTKEEGVSLVDPNFFEFFSIPVIAGDPAAGLQDPNAAALSASAARKYFGDADPIGKILILDDEYRYTVGAVYADLPQQSHFHFDLVLSMTGHEDSRNQVFLSNNYHTYITLREGADAGALESRLPELFKKYAGPQVMQLLNKSIEDIEATGQGVTYSLQPLRDIHLRSDRIAEIEPNSDIKYVYIFSSIALFILLIACINFMNLSTARSAGRAREVGVRKTLGALRSNLISQFLSESLLMSLLAFGLAVIMVEAVGRPFNLLVDRTLGLPWANPLFLGLLLGGALIIGLLAGLYPAFYLSAFRPVEVLKGKLKLSVKSGSFRNALVVFQFVISIFLIIGTLVINSQMSFIRNKKLGFDREQVLVLHEPYALAGQRQSFKEEVEQLPGVRSATYSSYLPVRSARSNTTLWPEGPMTEDNAVSSQVWSVDEDYIRTLGMEIIKGRDFSKDMVTDSNAIIINERAAALYGFDNPIGGRISSFDNDGPIEGGGKIRTYTVIGVVKDFHYESLRENVDALAMMLGRSSSYLAIRYQGNDPATLIRDLETKWKAMAPGQPFAYSFLDDRFEAMYAAEQRTGRIFLVFAILAIFVACLGLFALATFTAERRTKEIGVRKVMGASAGDIFWLLSSDFARWVALAYILAVPLGWLFARRWLADFQYQTTLGWSIFLLSALAAAAIALLAVSYQSLRAAVKNPVESLRYE